MWIGNMRTKWRNAFMRASGIAFALTIVAATAGYAADLTVLLPRYYEDPKLYRQYMETYQASPNFVFFETEEEALDLVRSGAAPDLAHICASNLNAWDAEGYLDEWDLTKLNVPEWSPGLDIAKDGLEPFAKKFVPFEYGLTRLMYNADHVPASDVSSLDAFTNPAYRGKVTLPAYLDDLAAAAFLSQGVTDYDMVDDAVFEAAIDWLKVASTNVHSFWQSEEDLVADIADGDILIAWAWNSIYYEMQDYSRSFRLAPESSGATHWTCGHVKFAGSDAPPEQVEMFVSSTLDRSAGRVIMSWGSGFASRPVHEDFMLLHDPAKVGLVFSDGPLLVQSPMPNALRERFKRAAVDIMARS